MTESQSNQPKIRFERENIELCAVCRGTGRTLSNSALAKARRGGNASFLSSLSPGQLSMSERGRQGGRPRELTLEGLKSMDL